MQFNLIKGFSKLSRQEKTDYLQKELQAGEELDQILADFRHPDKQKLFDDFSENTLSNYYLPFGVAPNFLINDQLYIVPMVIEESSVVAAASRAASFWAQHGGFKTSIHGTVKTGHIWFQWEGDVTQLLSHQSQIIETLKNAVSHITSSMEKRGGGILDMQIIPQKELPTVYQIQVSFNTVNSMGANFINSCLEAMKTPLLDYFENQSWYVPDMIMAILSNYTPNCLVTCQVECGIEHLDPYTTGIPAVDFARRFKMAVDIALQNPHRAVTHNKGIYNGIDAVVLATGNDFRAVEAAGHAYASRDGQYRSLSNCTITDEGRFQFSLTVPLALGTVGGLTQLHPLAALALTILKNPSATELMSIAAAAGLANNFSAVASLVTTGIQKGHMKLHLTNILNYLNATDTQKEAAKKYFKDQTISYNAVKEFLNNKE